MMGSAWRLLTLDACAVCRFSSASGCSWGHFSENEKHEKHSLLPAKSQELSFVCHSRVCVLLRTWSSELLRAARLQRDQGSDVLLLGLALVVVAQAASALAGGPIGTYILPVLAIIFSPSHPYQHHVQDFDLFSFSVCLGFRDLGFGVLWVFAGVPLKLREDCDCRAILTFDSVAYDKGLRFRVFCRSIGAACCGFQK